MQRKLINWLGLTGIISLISYVAAMVFAPSRVMESAWT